MSALEVSTVANGNQIVICNGSQVAVFPAPPPILFPFVHEALPINPGVVPASVACGTVLVETNGLTAPAPVGLVLFPGGGPGLLQPPSGVIPPGATGLIALAPDAPVVFSQLDGAAVYADATGDPNAANIIRIRVNPANLLGVLQAFRAINVPVNGTQILYASESQVGIAPALLEEPTCVAGFIKNFGALVTLNTLVSAALLEVLANGAPVDSIIVPAGITGSFIGPASFVTFKGSLITFRLDASGDPDPSHLARVSLAASLSA